MKAIKLVFFLLITLLIAIFVVGLFLPAKTHVERSITVDADAETLFPLFNDLKQLNSWSPWVAKDPNQTISYSDPAFGEGATMHWESAKKDVGTGSQRITESSFPTKVSYALRFGSQDSEAMASLLIEPTASGSEVTWSFDVEHDLNPMNRIFGLMMDSWVGSEYEVGLKKLKTLVESSDKNIFGQELTYSDGETEMRGYLAYDRNKQGKRPGVLVVHEWWGHNDYARKRARQLAEMGYTAFALDMYGEGKNTAHPKEAQEFMQAAVANPEAARRRFESAMNVLRSDNSVDDSQIAAIGYCFGGAVVLNMARMNVANLDAVVSFHGSLAPIKPAEKDAVSAKVMVFHGAADPFIPEQDIANFRTEMEDANVDYQFIAYPDVKHSFTNPGATEVGKQFDLALEYNKEADEDSWKKMSTFFKEVF